MAGRTARPMNRTEWVLLVSLSVLWGGSFFFSKVALAELRPFTVVLARVGLAALVLMALVYAGGYRMPGFKLLRAFLVMGVLNNLVPFSLIFWGQTQIASGLAAILNATTPLFTVVLAHVSAAERMTIGRFSGVVLGMVGVAVMLGPEAFVEGFGFNLAAQLACLGAALSYAIAGLYGRRFRQVPPILTAAGQTAATTLVMLPVALISDQPWTIPAISMMTVVALVGLAVFSTALAYVIYFRILATAGPANLLLVTFLIPVSALLLGAFLLGERPELSQLAGMALIALGLCAIDGRPVPFVVKALRVRNGRPDPAG